jgi:hypothetical protein
MTEVTPLSAIKPLSNTLYKKVASEVTTTHPGNIMHTHNALELENLVPKKKWLLPP